MNQPTSPGSSSHGSPINVVLDSFLAFLRFPCLIVSGIVGLHVLGILAAIIIRDAVLGLDVNVHNSIGMRKLFPFYDDIAQGVALAFPLAGVAVWLSLKSGLARFATLGFAWSLTFAGISILNPVPFLGLIVPGYVLYSSLSAGNAPTRFAPGFRWSVFNNLPSGLEESELFARLGPPLARFKTRDTGWSRTGAHPGDEILFYSDTAIDRDPSGRRDWSYWQAQVNLDAAGRVKSTWFGFRRDSTN